MIRHAWLQKHGSPIASGGEFHWYPDAVDRELRASFVERVRGIEPPAVLWHFGPGRVGWGQVFSAIAPTDGRRYVGLVLSVAEARATTAVLVSSLAPPDPEPWREGVPVESADHDGPVAELAGDGAFVAIARALISGGAAMVGDARRRDLPQRIGSLERVMPERREPREGVWLPGMPDRRDRVAELAVAAGRAPASREAKAWTILCELAAGRSLDEVGRAIDVLEARAYLTAEERAAAGDAATVVGVLHAWGRGRFDGSATLLGRLADLVALRIFAQLAAGRDANAVLAEARWTALLPAGRRDALLAAVAQRADALRTLVEAHHA